MKLLNTESLQKLQRFRSKTEKLIKIGKKCSCSSLCCWFTLYVNGGRGGAGRNGGIPEPAPNPPRVLKKIPYPSQTRLIHFYPIPLGAGRGGYPKKPAPLPSLVGIVQPRAGDISTVSHFLDIYFFCHLCFTLLYF